MSSMVESLQVQVERNLPIFLNGNTRKCLALAQSVLESKPHTLVHCSQDLETADFYREILRQSKCVVPAVGVVLDIQDVVEALTAAGYEWMILSGLQMLPDETKSDFAYDLKVAFETSSFNFLVIGSFPEGNPLLSYNGDLCGRMIELNVE